MPASISFRAATVADAEALARGVVEGVEGYRAFAPPEWSPPALATEIEHLQERLADDEVWCLLAEVGGEVVGQAIDDFPPRRVSQRGTAHQRRPKMISQIQLVMVPSTDQERSIEFYESLGFEKRVDGPFGDGYRWVEIYPPGASTGIALVPGSAEATGVQTGIIAWTDDVDATHAQLQSRGLDVDPAVARAGSPARIRMGAVEVVGPEPPMFYLRDPDGNALMIIQAPEAPR